MSTTDSPITLTFSSATASDETNGSSRAGTEVTRRSVPSIRASTASPRSGTSGDFEVDVTFQPTVKRSQQPTPHPYALPPMPSTKVPRTMTPSNDGSWIVEGSATPSTILNTSTPDVGRGGHQSEDSIMCLSNGCENERALIQSAIEVINCGALEITKNQLQARDFSTLMDQRSRQALSRYEEEVLQARTIANQMYTEAKVEQLNSEVYQSAVVKLGNKRNAQLRQRRSWWCSSRNSMIEPMMLHAGSLINLQ